MSLQNTTLVLGERRSSKSHVGRALAMGLYTGALQGEEPPVILLVEAFADEDRRCWKVTDNHWIMFPRDENVSWKEHRSTSFLIPDIFTHLIWVTDLVGGIACPYEYNQLVTYMGMDKR